MIVLKFLKYVMGFLEIISFYLEFILILLGLGILFLIIY